MMMNFTVDCVRGNKDGVVLLITADAGARGMASGASGMPPPPLTRASCQPLRAEATAGAGACTTPLSRSRPHVFRS
jgi:hypothetical protein